MVGFNMLPNELIAIVATHLDTEAFTNLRLVCKIIESKLFPFFIRHYFSTRYHMFSRNSLETLCQIAEDPRFGPAVHALEICIDHLTEGTPYVFNPGLGLPLSGERSNINQDAHSAYLRSQKYLQESGLDTAYLVQALSKLSNCKSILLTDAWLQENPRFWGTTSLCRLAGENRTSSLWVQESEEFVQRLLHIVLVAVMASRLPLEEFGVFFGLEREAIRPEMLILPAPCREDMLSRLTTTRTLVLRVDAEGSSPTWATDLAGFIHAFPALERLDLSFERQTEEQRFKELADALHCDRLRVLEISCAICATDDLIRLFLNHQDTLNSIVLDSVDLGVGKGDWKLVLEAIRDHLRVTQVEMCLCRLNDKTVVREGKPNPQEPIVVSGEWEAMTEAITSLKYIEY